MSWLRPPRLAARCLSGVLFAASLSACSGPPVPSPLTTYDPEVIGVIESVTETEGGALVRLTDGSSLSFDQDTNPQSLHGRFPYPGYLILYGSGLHTDWHVTLRGGAGLTRSCYAINAPALDAGAFIHFSFGLRLPKAPNFDPGVVDDGEFSAIRHQFCINDRGQVVAYE